MTKMIKIITDSTADVPADLVARHGIGVIPAILEIEGRTFYDNITLTRADFYREALPGAADVLLLIEVADSSVEYDREIKIPLYARHAIPEVWLLDLRERIFHVYQEPDAGVYRRALRLEPGETISPLLLSSARIVPREIWAAPDRDTSGNCSG